MIIEILFTFLHPCCLIVVLVMKHRLTLIQPHFSAEGRSRASWDCYVLLARLSAAYVQESLGFVWNWTVVQSWASDYGGLLK